MTVNILGTEYTIELVNYDDKTLQDDWVGYCDGVLHRIVLVNLVEHPSWKDEPKEKLEITMKETMRHEIVHAFFNESGLKDSGNVFEGAWCKNEEMVDWIAIQGLKIMKAWQTVGCI